jgi:hypothetical protein
MKACRVLISFASMALVAFSLSSCAGPSTQFTDVWKDPNAGMLKASKVLALFLTADLTQRRVGEDELVRQISPRAQAIASYTFLDTDQVRDVEYAKAKVKEMGFDVAVTMRLVGVDEKTTYVPGSTVTAGYPSYSGSYWGYYGYGWTTVYEPGYMETNKYVTMETNIYSVTQDKLLWTGHSETVDPSSVSDLVSGVTEQARTILIEQGLIAKP